MKTSLLLLLIFCGISNINGQSHFVENYEPVPNDSIFNLGGNHFRYKGLTFDSPRALKKVLNIDKNSDLYQSVRQYIRTRRFANVFEIIGIGSIGATVDGFFVPQSEVRPIPLMIGLASVGTSLIFWKKSNRQFNNFVDDYNHAVYDKYIQDKFMNPKLIPNSQINVGVKIRF